MDETTAQNGEILQQLAAGRAAQEDGRWQEAIAAYTAALDAPGLSTEQAYTCREGRAFCYGQLGDLESQRDDLLEINQLLHEKVELSAAELEANAKVQSALYKIAEAASEGLELQAFFARVHEIVGGLMYAENFFIALYDEVTRTITWPYFADSVDDEIPQPRVVEGQLIKGGTELVLRRGQPVHSPREDSEALFRGGGITPVGPVAEDWIGIPLQVEEKTIGVLVVQSYLPEIRYTGDDFQLLIFVARHIATALERARAIDKTRRLLNETEARNSELAVINSIQAGLAEQLDFQAIVDLVGDKLREVLRVGNVSIAWLDHERMMGIYLYSYVDGERVELEPWSLGPTGRAAAQDRQPVLWRTATEADEKGLWTREGEKEALSGLFVPISGRDRAIGAIRLEDYENEYAFDESVQRLVSTIAASMGVALENARLLDEVQTRNAEITESLERQSATSAVLHAMASSPTDLQPVLVAIAENAARLCKADDVQIYRVDGDQLRQIAHHGPLPALQDGEALPLVPGLVTGRAALEGRTIHMEDSSQLAEAEYPDSVALQKRLKHRTVISTPMLREGAAIGAIVVRRNEVRPFSERQIALLSTFANQAAIAMDNVRLFTETQERNAELAIINSVGEAMARKLDVETVVGIVGDRVQEIFQSEIVMIGLIDEGTGVMQVPYLHKEGERFKAQPIPLGKGMVAQVMEARVPRVFGTYEDQIEAGAVPVEAEGTENVPYESWMGVPIIVGDRVIGSVAVQNMARHSFQENDVRLLSTLGTNMGVAIENARLFDETTRLLEETEERNAELAIINSVQEGLVAKLDQQAIYDLVGDKIQDIFDAQAVMIFSYDLEREFAHLAYMFEKGQRFYLGSGPFTGMKRHLIETKKPLLINENLEARGEEFGLQTPAGEASKSGLWVPLIVGGEVTGDVSIQNIDREQAFDEADVRLLTTLASSMSVALENARLFDETAQRNAELAIINSVQQALASQVDMQGIYDVVGDQIRAIFDAQAVMIFRYDLEREIAHPHYLFEKGERFYIESLPFTGLKRHLIETRSPLLINENLEERAQELGMITAAGEASKSGLWVPLLVGGEVAGEVTIQNIDREHAFTESDARLLTTLATSMSVALENARLFDETNQRAAELAIINSVGEGLASQLDFEAIIELVGDKVREIFQADTTYIGLYDTETNFVSLPYYVERGHRHELPSGPPGKTFMGQMIETRKPVLFGTMADQLADPAGTAPLRSPGAQKDLNETFLGVPIVVGEKLIGAVSVQRYQQYAYDEGDQRLLATIAANMGVALENARLFDATNRLLAETAQRAAELAIINSVGEGLASRLDFQAIIDLVGDKVREIFGADTTYIILYDSETELITPYYFVERGFRHLYPPRPMGDEIASKIIRTRKPVLYLELAEQDGLPITSPGADRDLNETFLGVPILSGDQVLGAVSVQNYKKAAYDEGDQRLLATIAANMGVALENARLFDETNQRNAELAIINSVGESMARKMDVETVTRIVGDRVIEIFLADVVAITLVDQDAGVAHLPFLYEEGEYLVADPMPLDQGLAATIYETRQPLMYNSAERLREAGAVMMQTSGVDTHEVESWLGVPIVVGDKLIGGVSVQSFKPDAFKESDLRLLSTLAANMGVVIENARLFDETSRLLDETRQKAAELTTINAVSQALGSELELEALIEMIGDQMRQIFAADIAYVALLNEQSEQIEFPYVYGEELATLAVGEGLTGRLLQSGEPLLINREEDWLAARDAGKRIGAEALSYLGVPVKIGSRSIGALSVQSTRQSGRFDESDQRLLSTIAANVSAALRNAQLYQEIQRRAEEMATLAAVGRDISQELDLDTVLEQIAFRAKNLLDGRTAVIRLLEEDGSLPAVVAIGENAEALRRDEIRIGEGLTGNVVLTGEPEMVNEPLTDPRVRIVPGTAEEEDEAIIFAPLMSRERAIGVMGIWREKTAFGPFTDADLEFSVGLARQAAIAIENARLFDEVAQQKEYFESLFVNNPVAVVTVALGGEVISWNPAAERLFGHAAEEALGRNVDDLVATHPSIEEEARNFTARFSQELGGIHATTRRSTKDGHLVDVEVLGLPVQVDDQVMGYIVIYHDITEIERARQAAEEANQAKSAFLANMSHELRTPLNAIIGFTRIVKRKGAETLPERQVENLEKVLISADHLLGLINTVLDIAKIEAGRMDVQPSTFELEPLIDLCVGTSLPLLKPGVELKKEAAGDLPPVFSDQDKVKQIVINLLSNAAKFTDRGEIVVSTRRQENDLLISVRDTGIGISADSLGQIFEEFQQVDASQTREYGGTGLGLSISRSLAQLLGGDLSAVSAKGEGSTFTLRLPLHYDGSPAAVPAARDGLGRQGEEEAGQPVVLVIDDHPDVVYLLRENLGDAGYRVVGALSGDEGLARARELKPFAITLDIMMPQKDGWQVLHDLKSDPETRDIPVIMVSIVDNRAMGYRLGAADYLVKPLEEGAVRAALDRLTESNGGVPPRRLLVVDDDPQVIDMIRELLEGTNFVVDAAEDGKAGLEHMRDDPPDALLLDLLMPGMDGFAVLEHLQDDERLRTIPVVVLTAKSLTAKEAAALQKGVTKIIKKQGLEGEQLIADLRQALGHAGPDTQETTG